MSSFLIISVFYSIYTSATDIPTTAPLCDDINHDIDLILVLDSSGSVTDVNWLIQLDFAKSIVNSSLPINHSRVGLINFSGCSPSYTFEQCKDPVSQYHRLRKEWGLNRFGTPNDLEAVYGRIASMDTSDYLQGNTWTNEALTIALNEFAANSSSETSKTMLLITDGKPFPESHAPCTVNGNISDTLQSIRDSRIKLIVVLIGFSQDDIIEYAECMVQNDTDLIQVADFASLGDASITIEDHICTTHGPTDEPTIAPTAYLIATDEPTIAPTADPTVSPTSNPTYPTKQPTDRPSTDPTEVPTTNPSLYPTVDPTGNPSVHPTIQPSVYPTIQPSVYPTLFPTKAPTEHNELYFFCDYNDEQTLITAYLSLSDYADVMVNAIIYSLESMTLQPIFYDEVSPNPYALWNKGGILRFSICNVFNTYLPNYTGECPVYDESESSDDGTYICVGVFDIAADNELSDYQQWLIEMMTSEMFREIFTEAMNIELENVVGNRRRLLMYNSFEAINIDIKDPSNDIIYTTVYNDVERNENNLTNTEAQIELNPLEECTEQKDDAAANIDIVYQINETDEEMNGEGDDIIIEAVNETHDGLENDTDNVQVDEMSISVESVQDNEDVMEEKEAPKIENETKKDVKKKTTVSATKSKKNQKGKVIDKTFTGSVMAKKQKHNKAGKKPSTAKRKQKKKKEKNVND